MRQLRLVGLGEDGASVVLATPTGDEYRLPVDERLRAACRGDLTRLGQIEIELGSPLRPAEIQARVRAGESAEEVAASSGMPLDRVLRFASPMLQERERIVAQARGAALRPGVLLGELVESRLIARGTDASTLRWNAWRREDGLWTVRLSWRHAAEHSASWTFRLAGRVVDPADPAAEQLSAVEFHARTITAVTPLAAATPMGARSGSGTEPRVGGPGRAGGTGRERPGGGPDAPPKGPGRRPDRRDGDGRVGDRRAADGQRAPGGTSDASAAAGLGAGGAGGSGAARAGSGGSGADAAGSGGAAGSAGSAGSSAAGSAGSGAGAAAGAGVGERSAAGGGSAAPGAVRGGVPGRTTKNTAAGRLTDRSGSRLERAAERAAAEATAGLDPDEVEPVRRIAAGGGGDAMLETPEEERARRASVPSWDDILLGVRRRH